MKSLILGMLCLISSSVFGMYVEINLNESNPRNPFSDPRPRLDVFRVIEKAANDNKVQGIILNIGSVSADRAYLWELRNALEKFKSSGKKIVAYFSYADIDIYLLASVADKIIMDDLGTLSIMGYSVSRGYIKDALEKIGIGVRELRYFEYKSAGETFTRDSMSEADRRQYGDFLDDIFKLTCDTLKSARSWTDEEIDNIINNDFLYSARSALSRNIVDFTGGRQAVFDTINEIEGIEVNNFALYGNSASSLTNSRTVYSPPRAGVFFRRPPVIAVVHANGQTDMHSGIAALNLSQIIRELAGKSRVKAIVVRINSPGGSAEAADSLSEAIRYAKERKPVVVSLGETAASGGYWAAINASHIMASPYTVTGSIGVIGSWFYDNGLNGRIGINTDTLQRGAHADLLTGIILPNRDLTDHEEERYRNYIQDIYNIFVNKVAEGRRMDVERVEAAAQGRIFSGTRALEAGLIDSIGSFCDALRIARELAKIPENKAVRYDEYPKPGFLNMLIESFPVIAALFRNRNNNVSLIADLLLPLTEIRYRLERNGKVMPLLPMDFVVR